MNFRGQAAIEALVCSFVWVFGMVFLLKAAFNVTAIALLDDWTDEYLFCRDAQCESRFAARLRTLGIKDYEILVRTHGRITLSANLGLFGKVRISKEANQ